MESDTLLIISIQISSMGILMEEPLLIAFSVICLILYATKVFTEMSIQKKSIEHLKNINKKWGKK